MSIRDKLIFLKAKMIFKKTHDKVSVIWYLNKKYSKNLPDKKIISILNKIEESL